MKQKVFTYGTGRLYTTGEFVSYRGAVAAARRHGKGQENNIYYSTTGAFGLNDLQICGVVNPDGTSARIVNKFLSTAIYE